MEQQSESNDSGDAMTLHRVTEAEAKILKKFHRVEVRYYVETDSWKGSQAKINGRALTRKGQYIQLTTLKAAFKRKNTITEERWNKLLTLFENDPVKTMLRLDAANAIQKICKITHAHSQAFIGDVLRRGYIRYVGD